MLEIHLSTMLQKDLNFFLKKFGLFETTLNEDLTLKTKFVPKYK